MNRETSITHVLPRFSNISRDATAIQLLEDFLLNVRIKGDTDNTKRTYGQTCRDFLTYIRDLPLISVKPRDIRDYLAWLVEQGASHNSLAQKRYALGAFFKHLEMHSIVPVSPCRSVSLRRLRRKLPRTLTVEEIERLIEATENPRDRAIICVFYSTGCRVSELAGMRIENIDWSDRPVIKILGKGDKERLVPLNREAVQALRPIIGDRKDGYVFDSGMRPAGSGTVTVNGPYWYLVWTEGFTVDGERCSKMRRKLLGRVLQPGQQRRPYQPPENPGGPRVYVTGKKKESYRYWAIAYREPGNGVRHTQFIGNAKKLTRDQAQAIGDSFLRDHLGPDFKAIFAANHSPLHRPKGTMRELTRDEAWAEAEKVLQAINRPSGAPTDKPLSVSLIGKVLKDAGKRAGIDHVHPHLIRHSFASHLIEGGADVFTVKELLGHESINTTQIYLHVSTKHLFDVMRKYHPHFEVNHEEKRP